MNDPSLQKPKTGAPKLQLQRPGHPPHSTAFFNELIGSTGNGLLVVNGASTLGPDAMLNIDLLGGFTPFFGETFTLMDYVSGSGTFANAPTTGFQMAGFDWTIGYNATDIVLDAGSPVNSTPTPEPDSLVLLSIGLAALAFSVWKKRVSQPIQLSSGNNGRR